MEIIIKDSPEKVADEILKRLKRIINKKRHPVIGLPTGNTPKIIYKKMIEAYDKGEVDFSEMIIFSHDEYVGIPSDHPKSTKTYFKEILLNRLNIPEKNLFFINGTPDDLKVECRRVEEAIRDVGGIDFQLLGIGRDGHIGFNEPGSSLSSRTRVKPLTFSTIKYLSQFFGSEKDTPRFCITMGIGTLMDSKEIAIVAFGDEKKEAIKKCVEGPITSAFPASIIQMHPKAKVYLDNKAASLLDEKDYYIWAYENKDKMYDYLKNKNED